jgi:hypothetical protein
MPDYAAYEIHPVMIATAGKCAVNALSMAVAGPCVTGYTWLHWLLRIITLSFVLFICAYALLANQRSLLSQLH